MIIICSRRAREVARVVDAQVARAVDVQVARAVDAPVARAVDAWPLNTGWVQMAQKDPRLNWSNTPTMTRLAR